MLHRATLRPHDVVLVDGTPVTSVARTLIDLARSQPLRTSVPAIDAALQRRLVTRAELERTTLEC